MREDPIPKIQTAGKIIATGGYTSDHSIRADMHPFDKPGNPGTPQHIRKFRKTANNSPG